MHNLSIENELEKKICELNKDILYQQKIIEQLAKNYITCPGEYDKKYLNTDCGVQKICIKCRIRYAESQIKEGK